MEKLRLLGILFISVIALVSASMNSSDPLVSNLLNIAFIVSCVVIGVWLLRKTNLREALTVRQRDSRRVALAAEFPLTDSGAVIVIQDRRRLSDRRKIRTDFGDQKGVLTKMASH